jgi:hypothetical protein
MKKCSNCEKRFLCIKNQENICADYKKEPYTTIKKVDGNIKIIERIN